MADPIQLDVSPCGTVHHDLRNGMMAIMGQVASLKHKCGPESHGELYIIKQQINRMETALSGCSNHNDMEVVCPS